MQKERTTERKEAAASAKEKKIPVPARMTVEHGLRQLAFGDISDAVRLIFGPLQRSARFLPAEGAAEKGSDDGGKA